MYLIICTDHMFKFTFKDPQKQSHTRKKCGQLKKKMPNIYFSELIVV